LDEERFRKGKKLAKKTVEETTDTVEETTDDDETTEDNAHTEETVSETEQRPAIDGTIEMHAERTAIQVREQVPLENMERQPRESRRDRSSERNVGDLDPERIAT
jgi:hypothetical protein